MINRKFYDFAFDRKINRGFMIMLNRYYRKKWICLSWSRGNWGKHTWSRKNKSGVSAWIL